jgi:hypothetical protein
MDFELEVIDRDVSVGIDSSVYSETEKMWGQT